MKPIYALLLFAALGQAATLTIAPSTSYDCQNGYASVLLTWNGASGPVQIHALMPNGPDVTGFNDPSGSTTTGNWVGDGLPFFLVDQAGSVEATATAHVSCGGTPDTLTQGFQGGSYFPLQTGNIWVYRYSDRTTTNAYVIRMITGTVTVQSTTWFVMDENDFGTHSTTLYRGDDAGNIWVATPSGTTSPTGEQIFLPANAQKTSYAGPLGKFTDVVTTTTSTGIPLNTSNFARGVGLVSQSVMLLAGSSGGFSSQMDLLEARLNGIRLSVPAGSIDLTIETTNLDLTDQKAPNCTLPCYFVACGLGGPQPDPMGTYRPCAQTRLETSSAAGDTAELQLLDPSGTVVFDSKNPTDSSGNSLNYIRLPLYTAAQAYGTSFTLLPPGNYKLVGRLLAMGVETASSTIDVLVQ